MTDVKKQLRKFDFTLNDKDDLLTHSDVKDFLTEEGFCKKWGFQKEKGTKCGTIHYQGRFNLEGNPKRIRELPQPFKEDYGLHIHYSPTSKGINKENFYNYVTKDTTRIDGPFTDNDVIKYIPKQYQNKIDKYRPFQITISEMCKQFNERGLCNVLYCKEGNTGKSTLAHTQRLFFGGIVLPSQNDAYRLSCTCMNLLSAKNIRSNVNIFFDLPRCMPEKKELRGLFAALEQISTGYIYDDRNKYKDWDFDTPNIWVFTNKMPKLNMLSEDRWRLWTLNDDLELIKYVEKCEIDSDDDNCFKLDTQDDDVVVITEESKLSQNYQPKVKKSKPITIFPTNIGELSFD